MNQKALYTMFHAAVTARMRDTPINAENRHDVMADFTDGIHLDFMSMFVPKGSRAASPVCAILVSYALPNDPFIGLAQTTHYLHTGYKLHIMEAGYVYVANAGEAIELRSEHEDSMLREQSERLH